MSKMSCLPGILAGCVTRVKADACSRLYAAASPPNGGPPVDTLSSVESIAITATAHKIARILYHVLLTKEPYAETVFHRCDEQAQRRAEMRLREQAAQLGFQLLPIPATGD